MDKLQKKMNRYLKAIARRLNLPRNVKERVLSDLISSIEGRREAGKTEEEIYAELGSPQKVATELNEQMKEYTFVKSPWRWVCFALILICCVFLLFDGLVGILTYALNLSINSSVGIIGGADGPTAIFVTSSPDATFYQLGITLLLLIMGILGFYRLSRCPRK